MERRTADERTRVANPEAVAAELAQHYARILGQQADRQVSAVVRTCLIRLPSRLPIQGEDLRAVEELLERLVRLGEVGARDPIGSSRQIDDYIARCLGESASGSRNVHRALRAMLGHTVLVERLSRQVWVLRLAGLTDPSSKLHLALLAETPALYSLPASNTSAPLATEPSLTKLQEELVAERQARVEADKRREAADVELGSLRLALDEERLARGAADERGRAAAAQLAALERELAPLRRALDEERRARGTADERGKTTAAQLAALERELAPLRRALDEERRARRAADLLCQATAAQVTELERELAPLHRVLDEERRARVDADQQRQVAAAQLAVLEWDLAPLRRALDEERLARVAADERGKAAVTVLERELELSREATRDAQAADAAAVWRWIETNQPEEALAFLAARMHGLNVEDAIETLPRLRQAAALILTPAVPADAEPPPLPEADRGRILAELQRTAADPPLPSQFEPVTPGPTTPPPPTTRISSTRSLTSLAPILDQPPQGPPVKPSKVGRNDPCPCGSGKKFKRCCGRFA